VFEAATRVKFNVYDKIVIDFHNFLTNLHLKDGLDSLIMRADTRESADIILMHIATVQARHC